MTQIRPAESATLLTVLYLVNLLCQRGALPFLAEQTVASRQLDSRLRCTIAAVHKVVVISGPIML